MPDVFWLGEVPLPPGEFTAGLRALGLKTEWIQEVHSLGTSPEIPVQTVYRWPDEPAAAHRLLHFACQALQTGDLDVLLLAAGETSTVLASPRAVGRWNLLPRANLSARFSYPPGSPPEDFLPALALQMAAAEIDAEAVGLASAPSGEPFPLAPAFPAAAWLETDANLPAGLNRLCAAVEAQSAAFGLLFSPGLASVIERV